MPKAIFLDRDGTLNHDPGYLSDPDQLELISEVPEALKLLSSLDYFLVVISNQSGIGRGLFTESKLHEIHHRLNELLFEESGVRIDAFFFCPHAPEANCSCRKPLPKLIREASERFKISLEESVMIGDRLTDLQAGRSSKCSKVGLVRTGRGRETEKELINSGHLHDWSDFVGDSILDVAHWVQNQ